MKKKYNYKKEEQLGESLGRASNRLRKTIMLDLLKKLNMNFCYRCGEEIETPEELSIEHKIAWLDSEDPISQFFDLNNIAFSHLSCNSKARHYGQPHGASGYKKGCRCDICKTYKKEEKKRAKFKKLEQENNSL